MRKSHTDGSFLIQIYAYGYRYGYPRIDCDFHYLLKLEDSLKSMDGLFC